MLKKSVAITAVLLLITVFFNACSFGQAFVLSVDSSHITDGEFLYFLDTALVQNKEADAVSSAKQAALEYNNINSLFASNALSLGVNEKAELSSQVNSVWKLYGEYYTGIGVSKQELYSIKRADFFKNAVLRAYYGETGVRSVTSADALAAAFNDSFAAVLIINAPLFTVENGTRAAFSDERTDELTQSFADTAERIGTDMTMEQASEALAYADFSQQVSYISAGSTGYPEGFFNLIKSCEEGKAVSFELDDTLYLVYRESIIENHPDFYEKNRDAVLYSMYSQDFEKALSDFADGRTIEFDEERAAALFKQLKSDNSK